MKQLKSMLLIMRIGRRFKLNLCVSIGGKAVTLFVQVRILGLVAVVDEIVPLVARRIFYLVILDKDVLVMDMKRALTQRLRPFQT
jgi:hypothetical protein